MPSIMASSISASMISTISNGRFAITYIWSHCCTPVKDCVPHPIEHRPPESVVDDVRLTDQTVRCPGCTWEKRLLEQEADLLI
jgi:hypothetical protein